MTAKTEHRHVWKIVERRLWGYNYFVIRRCECGAEHKTVEPRR
jgi:hypothetical protein